MIYSPINNAQPINRRSRFSDGLAAFYLVGVDGYSMGLTLKDLCRKRDGVLTNLVPSTDYVRPAPKGNFGSLDLASASSQYVDLPSFGGNQGGQNMTAISWTMPNGGGNSGNIITNRSGTELFKLYGNGGAGYGYQFDPVGSGGTANAIMSQDATKWDFVVGRYDGASVDCIVYRQTGFVASASTAASGAEVLCDNWVIGRRADSSSLYANCKISMVAVWLGRALTDEEIEAFWLESMQGYPTLLNRIYSPVGKAIAGGSSVSATVAATIGGATCSGSATFTAPIYSATASPTVGGATASASASHTTPTYTASATPTTGGATVAASASFATVIRSATAAATIGGAGASASATFTAPVYTATAAPTVGGTTVTVSATHTPPSYTATASLTIGGATATATASFATSISTATAAVTTAGVSVSIAATFTAATFVAFVDTRAGVRVFDTRATARIFDTRANVR